MTANLGGREGETRAWEEPMTRYPDELLRRTAEIASEYLVGLPDRTVGPPVEPATLRAALEEPLPEGPEDPQAVVERFARDVDPGIVATAGPRYFGFVTGGSHPAALAADWLTAVWDQPTGLYVMSPANAVIEEVAAAWLIELLGLRASGKAISVGFTTGCTMANFTALAAARHRLLARAGWDVEADGLFGAPPIDVVVGEEAHATIFAVLQMLGLGAARVTRVPADGEGRMRAEALPEALAACGGPAIVCAQAGNVNSGAVDPLRPIAEACAKHGAWLHVDGAFGLWAAASPELRGLVEGVERADSWAADAHKWLNVPYDGGLVFVADPEAHRTAVTAPAAYLVGAEGARDPLDWVPEFSRRARANPVYAVLRSLGRRGVSELIERCCRHARRMAERLGHEPGIEILNEVVLNQVLVRFTPGEGSTEAAADEFTRSVMAAVQRDGTCWAGGTVWHGMSAMRISVSNWSTTEDDIERSADAILGCFREQRGAR